jgi:hypothetical protein
MDTRRGIRRLSRLTIIALFFNVLLAGQASRGLSGLRSLLPAGQESGAWKEDGPPQEFQGEDLYLYIDGGAEIYREYGFEDVLVQEYKDREGIRLSLEIFRMTSPESAYGMYTFKRSPRGTRLEIGAEGQLEDYYLNFWKGNFLVTITGQDKSPATGRGLLELARAVAGKIQGPSDPARLVAELPRPGLVDASVRYFKGYLGFMNNYSSLGKEAFRFEEGVRGDYSSGASLFILSFPNEEALRQSFPAIERAIKNDPRAKEPNSDEGLSFNVTDDRGKLLSLQAVRNLLLICLEDRAAADNARELFEAIRKSR